MSTKHLRPDQALLRLATLALRADPSDREKVHAAVVALTHGDPRRADRVMLQADHLAGLRENPPTVRELGLMD